MEAGRPLDWKPDLIWRHVAKGDGCWEWQAQRDKDGYGRIERVGRVFRAHRAAYELAYGPIPDGLQVCHTCDNPPCIRPDHLFLGTSRDNWQDSIDKGRRTLPQRNVHAWRFCDACGVLFDGWPSQPRRFCSRPCYLDVHSGRVPDVRHGDGGACGLPVGHSGALHRQLNGERAVVGSWPTT